MAGMLAAGGMNSGSAEGKSDDHLMAAYGRSDRTAFDELYSRYREPLYGYLYRNCRDEMLAAEMFQDVWLRVIASAGRYRRSGRFRSWLFTLAHNRLVDQYRRADNDVVTEPAENLPAAESPAEQARIDEHRTKMAVVVDALPIEQRQAFYLREDCGFSVRDIAEVQGIGVEAAKSRLRYAYAKLREAFRDDQDHET